LIDLAGVIFPFLAKEPFLFAGVLVKRLATNQRTVKEELTRDPDMRKFTLK
jgi:hypothetical protein